MTQYFFSLVKVAWVYDEVESSEKLSGITVLQLTGNAE